MATTAERQWNGKRIAVLWLLWSALVVLLLAAGIVVLRGDAPVPVGETARVAPAGGDAANGGGSDEQQRVVVDDGRPRASRWTGPTLPAQFCLRTSHGASVLQYIGPCDVQDPDGALLASMQSAQWPRTVGCALPLALPRVRLIAPGYRPVERELPRPQQGVLEFGDVVLEPDAALQVRIAHLPEGFAGTVECTVADNGVFTSNWTGSGAPALLPVPSGRALELRVTTTDKGLYACATVSHLRLQRDETRHCDVDLDAGPNCQLAIVGPSPELLPHLRLLHRSATSQHVLQLDAHGRVTLRGMQWGEGQFLLDLDETFSGLQARDPAAKVVELVPQPPIVGIRVVDDDAVVDCQLGVGETTSRALSIHLFQSDRLVGATAVHAWSESTGTLRWPTSAITWRGDLGTLDVRDATRGSDLTVVVATGLAPTPNRFVVVVQGADGTEVRRDYSGARFHFEDLAPGHYRVQWCLGRTPLKVIADDVEVVAGKQQEITTTWPATSMWHGEIDNWKRVPLNERMAMVGFGEFEGWALSLPRWPINEAGHFELPLGGDQEPPRQVTFFLSMMWCAGRVLAVDASTHTVHLEHPTDLRWVEVQTQPPVGGAWNLMLRTPGSDFAWAYLNKRFNRLFMPPSGTLRGMLCEDERVTAWVAIDGRERTVVIAPTGGHWCDLRLERVGTALFASVCGPDGQPAGFAQSLTGPGALRVWIAEDTRSVQVDLHPGGRQTFDAAQTEIVIR